METAKATVITVETTVKAPIVKVWEYWTSPEHVIKWNNPSEDWHTPFGENDLRPGGRFSYRMEAKDGSQGFDFGGVYDNVQPHELIEYTLEDGRKVVIHFKTTGNETQLNETFEAEDTHPVEIQRNGWQAILNSFKNYTETNN